MWHLSASWITYATVDQPRKVLVYLFIYYCSKIRVFDMSSPLPPHGADKAGIGTLGWLLWTLLWILVGVTFKTRLWKSQDNVSFLDEPIASWSCLCFQLLPYVRHQHILSNSQKASPKYIAPLVGRCTDANLLQRFRQGLLHLCFRQEEERLNGQVVGLINLRGVGKRPGSSLDVGVQGTWVGFDVSEILRDILPWG